MRVLVLLLVLVAAGLAVAAPTSVEMQETQCYNCHAPGLWNPPMQEPKVTEYRFQPAEDGWWFEMDVHNTWGHDMLAVSGLLDVSMHDGVSLRSVGDNASETHTGSFEPTLPPVAQFHAFTVKVPPPTQGLSFRLSSDGPLPHDLQLEVRSPCIHMSCVATKNHRGGTATEIAFTAEDLAAYGVGEWRVSVRAEPMGGPVDYRLTIEQAAGPSGLAWAGQLPPFQADPSETVTLRWPVTFGDDARGTAQVLLQYVSSYEHNGGEPDMEFLRMMPSVDVSTRDGTPSFLQLTQEEPEDESIPSPVLLALLALVFVVWRRR